MYNIDQVNSTMTKYEIFVEAAATICGDATKTMKVVNAYFPVLEATDGKGNSYETLKELAIWLLTEGNILNVFHWNVHKSNKHELLNEAYELCRDTGDAMAETYIALTGNDCKPSSANFGGKSSDWAPSDNEILATLKNINKHMNNAVKKNGDFSEGVKNLFADFDEKMTSIIYKFSQFDS